MRVQHILEGSPTPGPMLIYWNKERTKVEYPMVKRVPRKCGLGGGEGLSKGALSREATKKHLSSTRNANVRQISK